MVVTAKADESPRRTVDLQALNRVSSREIYHTPSPFNLVSRIPKGMYKSVLDCWNGYHSVPLDPGSREKMSFICFILNVSQIIFWKISRKTSSQ